MLRPPERTLPPSARLAAAISLAGAAERFPDLPAISLDTAGLGPQDVSLATAIHRTVLQRWITLEYLLNRVLSKPLETLEPKAQSLLLCGSAQLLFMDRLPVHAVVDEQVKLAKQGIRPGAAGLINAVLRKIADMVLAVEPDTKWAPARDLIPLDRGCVRLNGPILPETDRVARHLGVATSHPKFLVNRWVTTLGLEQTTQLCRHGIERPPVIVAVGAEFDTAVTDDNWQPHLLPGFIVWTGEHRSLVDFLRNDPAGRVQDPASALPIGSTRDLVVKTVLDYCAGRGTKTTQLAMMHRDAQVTATDVDDVRRAALTKAVAGLDNVTIVGPVSRPSRKLDLLVLDVPCSNTAVLARRPEARYRLDARTLDSLVSLQRDIIRQTIDWVAPGGHILYSTCSLEQEENQAQANWLAKQTRGQVLHEHQEFPSGFGATYQDGGYHALVSLL